MIDYGLIIPPKYHLCYAEQFHYYLGAATIGRQNVFLICIQQKIALSNIYRSPKSPNHELVPIIILGDKSEFKNNKFSVLPEYTKHKIDFLASIYEAVPELLNQNKKLNSYLYREAERLINLQILR